MTQETAKNILKEMHDKALFSERAALEAFFPEFKDDVDERIRKVIYGWIYIQPSEFFDNGFSKEEMLAWLEKQKYTKKDVDDAWLEGVASAKEELEKQGEEISQSDSKKLSEQIKDFEGEFGCWNSAQDFRPKHLQRCLCYDKYMKGVYCYVYDDISKYWCTQTTEEHDPDGDNHICDYADYRVTVWMSLPDTSFYPSKTLLEKQGEQKVPINDFKAKNWYVSEVDGKIHDMTYNPADKAEQKFKVGDWITDGDRNLFQIAKIDNEWYYADDEDRVCFDVAHDYYHLWTIQDAKDGDVLDANGAPFIYKKHNKDYVYFYCGVNLGGYFIEADRIDTWDNNNKVYPATKEQRELLFQKMAENGYAWDAEKKELSHQEVAKKSEHDGKKWIDEKVYWKEREELFEDGNQEVINNPMKYGLIKDEDHIADASKKVESKVWSEEDEICRNQSIEAATFYYGLPSETVNWLKSIKERVHPKSQWTGEDEIGFGDTLWAINKARTIAKDENDMGNLWYAEDWLKSVKEKMGG